MTNMLANNEVPKRRVLVVDEEHELLSPLTVQLERAGFEVWKARRGEEALHCVKEVRPELVVINPTLSDMNGFKLAVKIKQDANIPFLFLTDQLSDDFRDAALTVGALQYLSKSSRPDENVTQIRLAIQTLTENTASMEKKLDSTKKRQSMISLYTEDYQVDEKHARDMINMFARKHSVSIDNLAELHRGYRVDRQELRGKQARERMNLDRKHRRQVKEIEPELITGLTEFFEQSCNRRLEENRSQMEFGLASDVRSIKS